MMQNKWLFIAALSGFFCIAFGAFAAHALEQMLSLKALSWIDTGLKYQMFHTIALLLLAGLPAYSKLNSDKYVAVIGVTWSFGILLFSGSLYLLALGVSKAMVWITPIGGILFLIGWAVLAYRSIKN